MTPTRTSLGAALALSLSLGACSTTVSPVPTRDAALDAPATDLATDTTGTGTGTETGTDAVAEAGPDTGPDPGHCTAFPGTGAATVTGGGGLAAVIAEAARVCALGGVCLGADARTCVPGYIKAHAGSLSIALLYRRGDLTGSLAASGEVAAAVLFPARECVLAAADCASVARCLGAGPVPAALQPGDESLCEGNRMLVRVHGQCGNDAVVTVDCAAQGGRCVTADVGLAWCGTSQCPSAATRPQCQTGADFRECSGMASVEGSCAGLPWLDTPACWIDTDDNNVRCGSGQDCNHEYSQCAGDVVQHCGFHSDAVPNYVREEIRCAAIAPGLHCGPLPGTPGNVDCLAGSACVPGSVSCVGTVATACAFGVPAAVDCAALGGRCTATGCLGVR